MKNSIILLTLALVAFSYQSKAQNTGTDFREELSFGLKVGINRSNVYDAKGEDFVADPKFGFAGGVYLAVPIGKYIGIQPELLFSQKGFKASGNILGDNYVLTRTTDYIDLPIFFAVKPISALTLLAGPQFSRLIKRTDVFANGVTTIEQEREFMNENFRKNMMSFTIGADINLEHLVLGIRSAWDVQANNGDGTSSTPRYKNVWFQTTIGYRFY